MNVIFIDIDGPLLPTRMWAAAQNMRLLEGRVTDRAPMLKFDPGCVGLVARLCDLAHARLVLASNWRRTWVHGLDALHQKLVSEGLRDGLWHEDWALPVQANGSKALDLSQWLAVNDIDKGVFIDNQPISVPANIALIQVDEEEGFGLASYRRALTLFDAKDPRDQSARRQAA